MPQWVLSIAAGAGVPAEGITGRTPVRRAEGAANLQSAGDLRLADLGVMQFSDFCSIFFGSNEGGETAAVLRSLWAVASA